MGRPSNAARLEIDPKFDKDDKINYIYTYKKRPGRPKLPKKLKKKKKKLHWSTRKRNKKKHYQRISLALRGRVRNET